MSTINSPKITSIYDIKIGGKPVVTPEIERDILQTWNRQLFKEGIIPEKLYEKAIAYIEKL